MAFITGGSSGIGLGIARAFVDAGMKVAIGYRTQSHVDEAMQSLGRINDQVHTLRVDVTDRQDVEKAAVKIVQTFGKVHVLVSNAGVVTPATLSQTTYDEWDFVLSVNLNGVFNGVHAFLPRIMAHGEGGQIIATASLLGLLVLGGEQAAYIASKFAVVGMMQALRAELAATPIGVSIFCPGLVRSDIWDSHRNRPSDLGDWGVKPDLQRSAREMAARSNPQLAMDPVEAGRLLLRGMRDNDLYILTHSEFKPIMQVRNDALIHSFPSDLAPTEARLSMVRSLLRKSIYVARVKGRSGTRS